MSHKIRFFLLGSLLLATFSIGGASPVQGDRQFIGCWNYFPQGTFRSIFRDSNDKKFICGRCNASGQPSSGSCSSISDETLENGYWSS